MTKNKTVILVNPYYPFVKSGNRKLVNRRKVRRQYPPVNLLKIGGVLGANGYNVKILDCFVESNPFSFIDKVCSENDVIFLGITVKMAHVITVAQQLSYYVKANYPKIKVVWGGLLPTILPEVVLNESYTDYVVRGKGEETALALANAIVNETPVDNIPGIGFLREESFSEYIDVPQSQQSNDYNTDWSLISDKLNRSQVPYYAGTVTTSGCPLQCSFCYLTAIDSSINNLKRWYERPMEKVLYDVDTLLSYGMNVFTFQDDNFLMNKKRILPLIEQFKKREIYIEQCVTSIDTITREIIESIHPIIQQISYSIETVNPELQKILNKQIKEQSVIDVNKMLFDHDINSVHNFVFGIPGETDDDLRLNIDLAIKLRTINPLVRFTGMMCIPFPKSSLERWVLENLNMSVPWNLRLLATVDMTELGINPAYQPWIKDAEQTQFYNEFMMVFDSIFSRWQHGDDPIIQSLLKKKRINRLFEEAVKLEKPPNTKPYILDRLLDNPDIPYPQAKFNLQACS